MAFLLLQQLVFLLTLCWASREELPHSSLRVLCWSLKALLGVTRVSLLLAQAPDGRDIAR